MSDFREITNELLGLHSQKSLAQILGCSVATVRQARLSKTAKAYRSPPLNWEKAVIVLARIKIDKLRAVIEELET